MIIQNKKCLKVYEPSPASESAGAGDAGTDSDSPAPPPPSGLSMSDNLYYGSGSTCNNTQGNPSDFYANSENVTRQVAPGYPSSALSNLVANMPELRKAGLTEIDGSTKSFFSGAEAKPPQLPCEDYPFASTHFRVGIGDSVAVANLLIKFFEGENGDLIVKTHKWVLKGQFVLGSSVFDMKIKAFSTSNSEVVFEYMHRSGCRVSARKVFSDCVTALRANSPCKIECPCISSQVETATDAHGATTEPPKVPEPNSANDADAMLSLVSMVEETVLCAKGYKGECLMALWRVVGRQRIEPKTLLDARLGSAIMNSMKSADTRESYVAENITCEIQIIYVVIVSRRFYQF